MRRRRKKSLKTKNKQTKKQARNRGNQTNKQREYVRGWPHSHFRSPQSPSWWWWESHDYDEYDDHDHDHDDYDDGDDDDNDDVDDEDEEEEDEEEDDDLKLWSPMWTCKLKSWNICMDKIPSCCFVFNVGSIKPKPQTHVASNETK